MDDIKTFEEVYADMKQAYSDYLASCEAFEAEEEGLYKVTEQDVEKRDEASDKLWQLSHQVLSNALFILNTEEKEDEFIYEYPPVKPNTAYIAGLLKTSVGNIRKFGTVPVEGIVWFVNDKEEEIYDDDQRLNVWEVYCLAVALYKMTEPFAGLIEE